MSRGDRITDYAGEVAEGVAKLMVESIGHLEPRGTFMVKNAIKIAGVPYGVTFKFERLTKDEFDAFEQMVGRDGGDQER